MLDSTTYLREVVVRYRKLKPRKERMRREHTISRESYLNSKLDIVVNGLRSVIRANARTSGVHNSCDHHTKLASHDAMGARCQTRLDARCAARRAIFAYIWDCMDRTILGVRYAGSQIPNPKSTIR